MAWAIYLVADALKLVHTLNRNIEEVYFSDNLEKELQKSILIERQEKGEMRVNIDSLWQRVAILILRAEWKTTY